MKRLFSLLAIVLVRIKRFWQWIGKLPPRKLTISLIVLIPVLIIVLVGGYYFLRFYDYTQYDPNFCRSCHLMEKSWDRWATSAHRVVGCHSCHEQTVLASAKQIIGVALGKYDRVEKHAVVPDEACKQCHESGSPRWLQVAATAGHKVHAEEQNIACVKCHSVTVHRFAPPGAVCSLCHEKHVEVKGMATMPCVACHQYLAEGKHLLPQRETCLTCHTDKTEHNTGIFCGRCHDLTGK